MTTQQTGQIDSSIIDLGALTKRVGGDLELISEIVHIFLDRYSETILKVRNAIVLQNPKLLERAAHSLRGDLISFHAKRAAEAALELERLGRCGDMTSTAAIFARLELEIDLLLPVLRGLVKNLIEMQKSLNYSI
jgi:HPt (histidine-containing phosphotransfer) domain-containing protein